MALNELSSILEDWRSHSEEHNEAVLATVVHVQGSAYRRPGARMLIRADGKRIGSISGGCLETDVARKAWWWTETGVCLRVFDHSVDDAVWDFGLGCNGIISVLLERLNQPATQDLLKFLAQQQAQRAAVVIATVINSLDYHYPLAERVYYDAVGSFLAGNTALAELLTTAIELTVSAQKSRLLCLEKLNVFVEWLAPPQRLFIFGAGHDAIALAAMARINGWQVTIADQRSTYLQAEHFPDADRIYPLAADTDISDLALQADDAVVLMTHNYPQDLRLLAQILTVNPFYIGLLGPRNRAEKLFAELGADSQQPNIYAPTGLDIGGEQPESIALAIAAEIQTVLSARTSGHLRQRSGGIHTPALELAMPNALALGYSAETILASCGMEYG